MTRGYLVVLLQWYYSLLLRDWTSLRYLTKNAQYSVNLSVHAEDVIKCR